MTVAVGPCAQGRWEAGCDYCSVCIGQPLSSRALHCDVLHVQKDPSPGESKLLFVNTSYAEHLISIFPKSDGTHEVHVQIIYFALSWLLCANCMHYISSYTFLNIWSTRFWSQRWGNFWERGWSAYGLFRTNRYHLELNWTELNWTGQMKEHHRWTNAILSPPSIKSVFPITDMLKARTVFCHSI